jgi:hypothetical protein
MLCAADHKSLCSYHLRQAAGAEPDPEAVAAELLGSIEDFSTADSVNLFLGNLLKQLAAKRIERRDAIALAYISQLLLNSLPPLKREQEAEDDAAHDRQVMAEINAAGERFAKQHSSVAATVPGNPS